MQRPQRGRQRGARDCGERSCAGCNHGAPTLFEPGVEMGERAGQDGELVRELHEPILGAREARDGDERAQPGRQGRQAVLRDNQAPAAQPARLPRTAATGCGHRFALTFDSSSFA